MSYHASSYGSSGHFSEQHLSVLHTMAQEVGIVISQIILAFFLAVMLGVIVWALFGLLLLPVFADNMVTLLFSEGSGEELELRVRAYGWLRREQAKGGKLIIVDGGLTAGGLELAQRLSREHSWVEYCPAWSLDDYIELMLLEQERNAL